MKNFAYRLKQPNRIIKSPKGEAKDRYTYTLYYIIL